MRLRLTTTCALLGGTLAAQTNENVLVIVVDDLGKEVLSLYNTPTELKANTPNIDRLASQGIVFDNVWGCPLSAPVRAAMLTGKHGHNTGIVALDIALPQSEVTLFEALSEEYTNAVIGKWHLSEDDNFAPNYGIDHFAGFATSGGVNDYNKWKFTKNGKSVITDEYTTTNITNQAVDWISAQDSPWVCWVAYNAPHTPFHLPPSQMHTHHELSGDSEDIANNPIPYFIAMVESMDYEIGRLLESIDKDTTIILMGDNGTEKRVLQQPYSSRHGKGSLYESGVAIPMIVYSKGATQRGTRCSELVSAPDIFPSVLEFTGAKLRQYEDGYSFVPCITGERGSRQYNFTEILNQRNGYMNAISDGRFKLISYKSGKEELYDIEKDMLEQHDLLKATLTKDASAALNSLRAELTRMNISLDKIPETNSQRGNRRGNRRK